MYEAEDLKLTLMVRDVEVSVTPELVEVIAHEDDYPVINRVLDEHGLLTFTLAHDLYKAHNEGTSLSDKLLPLPGFRSGQHTTLSTHCVKSTSWSRRPQPDNVHAGGL